MSFLQNGYHTVFQVDGQEEQFDATAGDCRTQEASIPFDFHDSSTETAIQSVATQLTRREISSRVLRLLALEMYIGKEGEDERTIHQAIEAISNGRGDDVREGLQSMAVNLRLTRFLQLLAALLLWLTSEADMTELNPYKNWVHPNVETTMLFKEFGAVLTLCTGQWKEAFGWLLGLAPLITPDYCPAKHYFAKSALSLCYTRFGTVEEARRAQEEAELALKDAELASLHSGLARARVDRIREDWRSLLGSS